MLVKMFKKWALLALTESESFDIVFAAPKNTSGSVETNGPSLEESAELHNDKSQFQIDANSWGLGKWKERSHNAKGANPVER